MTGRGTPPRRELVTLLAYLDAGSHKAAAHRLGISESTSRQRVSQLIRRVGAGNAAQAVWRLRHDLEAEAQVS
jgi:DNA-binding NarL/FixJ family response regulator